MRKQWLRRLLKNPLLNSSEEITPFARLQLKAAGSNGQTIGLCMDQSDLGNTMALLMISVRIGGRALPYQRLERTSWSCHPVNTTKCWV